MLSRILPYLNEIKMVYSCYPNNFFTGSFTVLKMIWWHLIIKPFSKKDFVGKYIFGIRMWYNSRMDGCKYSFFLPKIDYVIKHLEHTYLHAWDVFFDVGANIGNHALIAHARGSQIHAFEPNDLPRSYLQKNIELNGSKGEVMINSCLVGQQNGEVDFYEYPENLSGLSSFIRPEDISHVTIIKKQIQTLDEYIITHSISRIKILKIDVEWAEPDVFVGMKNSLEKGIVDIIYWESNSLLTDDKKQKILMDLEQSGYQNFEFDERIGKLLPYESSDNCLSIHSSRGSEILKCIDMI